ncbi:MAG: glutamyl-tRNA reductase, partial [Vallitaleaceae bacterium]|nr:glutamyl-tRNA reductase [Vallitaleaceae bacterium]
MYIGVVGISHKQAPVKTRNAVAFTQSKKIEAMNFLLEGSCVEEVVILSTCNRSEIYFATNNLSYSMVQVKTFYLNYFGVPQLDSHVFTKSNEEAIQYLLTVTSGLDSIVLGEDQILGQVKEDHDLARQMGCSKKMLNKIFRDAITFAKKMKTTYKISENPLSISSVAIKLLEDVCPEFTEAKVLLIGAGTVGMLCLKYLQDAGLTRLFMCNRTMCTLEEQLIESE